MEERAKHIQVTDDVEDSWTLFCDTMWCTKNMLSCNPSKTKILQLLSRFSRTDSPPTPLLVGQDMIVPVLVAQDLSITLDKHLTLHQHINNVSKSGSYAIRNIGQIRKYLNNEDCEKLVHAFVTSSLDCCNSILYGLPDSELAKLQQIQNTAARLVVRLKKCDHITPVLQKLHWLPVKSQINYKILLLTYKALNGLAPSYLSELPTPTVPHEISDHPANFSWQLRKLTLWTMVTELSPFVHQNSGTIFHSTLDRPNPYQVLNLNLKLTYLIIVSLIIFKFLHYHFYFVF